MLKLIINMIFVVIVTAIALTWMYTQRFNQDSDTTATQGVFFTKTLNLNAYKRVSDGISMWGEYSNYSRSDRHDETVTVYCNEFCK